MEVINTSPFDIYNLMINLKFGYLLYVKLKSKKHIVYFKRFYSLSCYDYLIFPGEQKKINIKSLTQNSDIEIKLIKFNSTPRYDLLSKSLECNKNCSLSTKKEIKGLIKTILSLYQAEMIIDKVTLDSLLDVMFFSMAKISILHVVFFSELSFYDKVNLYVNDNYKSRGVLVSLSEHLNISRSKLMRLLKMNGIVIKDILLRRRMENALIMIERGELDIFNVSEGCGYKSTYRFNEQFKKHFGCTFYRYVKEIKQ
ncbi:helix-turn-helix transcriptional regulator [Vibrio harveyi]|uniref:helix-turn-helix transcriptional regulator n=1 Tax=Vibrio harveyi TaxID=669 RepID=UPI00041B78FD|nr:AraC family transcriptional regulator [Vibrio harveyi]